MASVAEAASPSRAPHPRSASGPPAAAEQPAQQRSEPAPLAPRRLPKDAAEQVPQPAAVGLPAAAAQLPRQPRHDNRREDRQQLGDQVLRRRPGRAAKLLHDLLALTPEHVTDDLVAVALVD